MIKGSVSLKCLSEITGLDVYVSISPFCFEDVTSWCIIICVSKGGFKGLCRVSSPSQSKHKSAVSLISALHSHQSLSLLGTPDSLSELQAFLKRKAFIKFYFIEV